MAVNSKRETTLQSRILWIKSKRYDTTENGSEATPFEQIKRIKVDPGWGHDEIDGAIRAEFDIPRQGIIMKLRNQRNSIIPVSESIPTNLKVSPYTLEVVKEHQFIKVAESSVKTNTDIYNKAYKSTLTNIVNRLETLEADEPEMCRRKTVKLQKDVDDMTSTVAFMNQRLCEFEGMEWNGMFKKNPMW